MQTRVLKIVRCPEDAVVLRKGHSAVVKKLERGSRRAVQYVSTYDLDRDGEILDPAGAILEPFRKNPVVLWGHNYAEPPIGSDLEIGPDGYGILADSQYATTERAREIFTLKQEGHLRTQSVGLIPVQTIERDGGRAWRKAVDERIETWGVDASHFEGADRIVSKWIMLEHSDVSVPSNPNALAVAVSKGLTLSARTLREFGLEAEPVRRILRIKKSETDPERAARIAHEVIATLRGRV